MGGEEMGVARANGGLTRRDLIKRGAVAGGLVWTAPLILESAAAATTAGCSPCDCVTFYSGKWDTSAANLCSAVLSNPSTAGPNGIDPTCGNASGGPSAYQPGTLSTLQVVSCSTTSITFRVRCSGHIYGVKVKGGSSCTETTGGVCTTELTVRIPSNLSHIVVYWCCC